MSAAVHFCTQVWFLPLFSQRSTACSQPMVGIPESGAGVATCPGASSTRPTISHIPGRAPAASSVGVSITRHRSHSAVQPEGSTARHTSSATPGTRRSSDAS